MVSTIYLDSGLAKQMQESFSSIGAIVLPGFLKEKEYKDILKTLDGVKGRKRRVPDSYSYDLLDFSELKKVFEGEDVRKAIENILGKKAGELKVEVKRFGHRDYTLIHDSENVGERFEFFFFLCPEWKAESGGMKVYSSSSEDAEPLVFLPEGNSFCLIHRKKDMNSFVKYVNNLAGKKNFVLVEGFIDG
jgi:hypothetical protein